MTAPSIEKKFHSQLFLLCHFFHKSGVHSSVQESFFPIFSLFIPQYNIILITILHNRFQYLIAKSSSFILFKIALVIIVPLYFHINFIFFLRFFFDVDYFFKIFIEFVTLLLLIHVLDFWPQGMWDLSSPIRDRTRVPCIGRRSLNHWTAREVPI